MALIRSSLYHGLAIAVLTTAALLPPMAEAMPRAERLPTHSLPLAGQTMTKVLQQFGEPVRRHEPVGKPSITRWDYADWSVYFQTGRVIHSLQRQKLPPAFETVVVHPAPAAAVVIHSAPARTTVTVSEPAGAADAENVILHSTSEMLHIDSSEATP